MIANDTNRVRGAVPGLSQDGACTDSFENFRENSLKGDLSNNITLNPPFFSLFNSFKGGQKLYTFINFTHTVQLNSSTVPFQLPIPCPNFHENHILTELTKCQAFCPVIRIGSLHPLTRKRVLPLFWSKGGDTLACEEEVEDPILTKGQILWYPVYL